MAVTDDSGPAPGVEPLEIITSEQLVTAIQQLLPAKDMRTTSIKEFRSELSMHFGLDRDGLDDRCHEIRKLLKAAIFEAAGKNEPDKTLTEMEEAEGESSGFSEDEASGTTARGHCGQFVWPCPREYPKSLQERKRQKWLKPTDLGKATFGKLYKKTATQIGLGPLLANVNVFDEPHKRYNPITGHRERHYHVVFKMKGTFAHLKFQKALAQQGVHGRFAFNLVGYAAYLNYVLEPSAKKLQGDIDRAPWTWPPTPVASLDAIRRSQSAQQAARNGIVTGRGRKRSLLTFSEITDLFVDNGVMTETDAWILAKKLKVGGDDVLWNTLGAKHSVSDEVAKCLRAWHADKLAAGTLIRTPAYPLTSFVGMEEIDPRLRAWVAGGYRKKVLIFYGPGGWGKTEYVCALLQSMVPARAIHFINKLDRLKEVVFGPGQGLVVDEMCLAERPIDDVKALLDLEHNRDVGCRNKDGCIPAHTPRALTTNWSWETFWPRECFSSQTHRKAILRRTLWVTVRRDLRLAVAEAAAVPQDETEEVLPVNDEAEPDPFGFGVDDEAEPDPFGFGGGLA